MDVLSAVLRELRLRSASYRVLRLRAPWRIRFDGGLRGVHLVRTGECDLTLAGAPPVRVRGAGVAGAGAGRVGRRTARGAPRAPGGVRPPARRRAAGPVAGGRSRRA